MKTLISKWGRTMASFFKGRSQWLLLLVLTGLPLFSINVAARGGEELKPLAAGKYSCRLQQVLDGDTVRATCGNAAVKIRMDGIDAPEGKQHPWGDQARNYLQQLLGDGQFTLESKGADYYDRTLGIIFSGEKNINLAMVQAGLAVAYNFRGGDQCRKPKNEYRRAHCQAAADKIGIWQRAGLQQDPKRWRQLCKNESGAQPSICAATANGVADGSGGLEKLPFSPWLLLLIVVALLLVPSLREPLLKQLKQQLRR